MPYIKGTPLLCINQQYPRESLEMIPVIPQKGQVYTVRNVIVTPRGWGVQFNEIINPLLFHNQVGTFEPSFSAAKFVILPNMN